MSVGNGSYESAAASAAGKAGNSNKKNNASNSPSPTRSGGSHKNHHGGHKRTTSEFVEVSRTSNFVHRTGFWIMYIFLILAAWLTLRTIFFRYDAAVIWTITLQAHAVISFVLIHWIRGSPEAQAGMLGEDVAHLTFWEQLEGGKFFGTRTRRFFIFVPIALFFLALIWTKENLWMLALNAFSTSLLLFAKTEMLFGARLFGVNKQQD